jgi:YVTN family beta-propeller protein
VGGTGCRWLRPRPQQERLFVSAEQSGEVVVVDPLSGKVLQRIAVGKRPRGLKLAPDGTQLFVALSGSPRSGPQADEAQAAPADRAADGIGVVDVKQGKLVGRLPGGQDPETFDLSQDGRALYIANEETAELSRLDLQSRSVTQSAAVGKQPEGVSAHPDGSTVYVACEEDSVVVAVDVRSGSMRARVPTGQRPRAIAFSADGHEAFVTNELDATVTVFDTRSHRVLDTIPITDPSAPPQRPMGIVRSSDGKHVYVSTGRGGAVAELDPQAHKLKRLYRDVGARPWGIALSPDGKRLYTANGPSNDLTILELATGQTRHVTIGGSPWGVVSGLQ